MTASNAAQQQVRQLIESQLYFAESLETLLQSEYSALLTSDIARLAEVVALKMDAAENLERANSELHHAVGGTPQDVVRALGADTAERWQQLGDTADRLRNQNLLNGAVLNERQNRLRWVAERAHGEAPGVYAPQARHRFGSGLSGRSIARA